MATERRRPRLLKLPAGEDIHRDVLGEFITQLGYDAKASVTRIVLHPRYVAVTLQPRQGVLVTVRHAVVGRELDE